MARRSWGRLRPLRLLVVVVILAGVAGWLLSHRPGSPVARLCSVAGATVDVSLDPDQARYAATITAVGLKMGLPDHAATIALATALQESKLQNLDYGDRDSVGLFQQRPSQGWGTKTQIMDPVYASSAFYERLVKLPNWLQDSVTDAAQNVQHSADASAYAQWEQQARAIAAALTGERPGTFTCQGLKVPMVGASIATAAQAEFGTTAVSGSHTLARSWALAGWLVAQAERFGVERIDVAGRTWTAKSGVWSPQKSGATPTLSYVLASGQRSPS